MLTSVSRFAAAVVLVSIAGCVGITRVETIGSEPSPGSTPNAAPTSTTPSSTAPTAPVPLPPGTIDWQRVDDETESGHLVVPLDWDAPGNGRTVSLYLVRHPATDPTRRIGTLLVNPGGPGAPGSELAMFASGIYTAELLEVFDIVGWDPRGTGASAPAVDCGDDYDRWFGIDSGPDTDAERAALVTAEQDLVDNCQQRSGNVLPFVDTISSARDIDAIRAALGEDTISYFGFSYGSELGAVWATLFPDTVRGAVLDGAADLTVPYFEQNVQQAVGFESALQELLDRCSTNRSCAFHNGGRAADAYDQLAAAIESAPLDGGRLTVTEGVLVTAVAASLYDERSWSRLEAALADAQDGDGAGLVELFDEYYDISPAGRPQSNLIEAYFAVGCLDDPGTDSADELYSRIDELTAAAPRMGASYQMELMVCALWPERPRQRIEADAAGAGPILVVGTTGDTATPFASTQALAASLDEGRLLTVEGDQHTAYGLNACVDGVVDSYLIDPTDLPDEGVTC